MVLDAGRFPRAAAYYASVKLMSSDEPRILARASAEWLASRGHHRGAIVVLERWTAAAPEDLYARVRLVELLQQTDNAQAAEKRARDALEVIDDPVLRQRLIDVLGASADAAQ